MLESWQNIGVHDSPQGGNLSLQWQRGNTTTHIATRWDANKLLLARATHKEKRNILQVKTSVNVKSRRVNVKSCQVNVNVNVNKLIPIPKKRKKRAKKSSQITFVNQITRPFSSHSIHQFLPSLPPNHPLTLIISHIPSYFLSFPFLFFSFLSFPLLSFILFPCFSLFLSSNSFSLASPFSS